MKKITITNAFAFETKVRHSELKDIFADGPEEMDASDGYHTFTELYEHRIALFIALCKQLSLLCAAPMHDDTNSIPRYSIWRSKLHADGSSYDGWFILGIGKQPGNQVSYHLPLSKWSETAFAETLANAPEWDGHTPADVLERLKKI